MSIVIHPTPVYELDHKKYGILFNLSGKGEPTGNTNASEGNGWTDVDTAIPLLDTLGRLGYTKAEAVPFELKEMEKHSHTQEAQIPTDQDIVVCVAAPSDKPRAEDVVAVLIPKGYVYVLHRDVWHSAAHGVERSGPAHWMALVYENEPTFWADLEGGSVKVTME